MRKILFRGIRKDNHQWEKGYYSSYDFSRGSVSCIDDYEVYPHTVGQYTGINDNTKWEELTPKEQLNWFENHPNERWNGKPIFEGDIIAISNEHMTRFNSPIIEVAWDDHVCGFAPFEYDDFRVHTNEYGCRVIGNIYDNPNLLKN